MAETLKFRKDKSLQEVPAHVAKAVANLHPDCRVLVAKCFLLNANAVVVHLDRMWQQGKIVVAMNNAEYLRSDDGRSVVNPYDVLSSLLECSEAYLRKMSQLYNAFP